MLLELKMPKGKKKETATPAPVEENKTTDAVDKTLPTERELQLKAQLDAITNRLHSMRTEIQELREENEFLQQEAQQTRIETHEYLTYISKKTQKRQSAVITLSERNAEKIKEIQAKKDEMIEKYNKEKKDLGDVILRKEAELSSIRQELEQLQDYKVLQEEQQSEISRLEKRVSEMRIKNNDAVQKLKAKFLEEKNEFHNQSEDKLKEISREAKKEAHQCLHEHTIKIKHHNRALRQELIGLIKRTRALHKHKLELEEQRKVLLREQSYANNLQLQRKERTKKLYEAHGFKGNEENVSELT